MTDRKQLRDLDLIEPPDRWRQISQRQADPNIELDSPRQHAAARRIGVAIVALVVGLAATAALALAFQDQGTTPAEADASVLRVTCDGNTATVQTPVVAVQPDGLHIVGTVTGVPNASIVVSSSGDPSATYLSGSSGVEHEFARDVPPGDAKVGCVSEPMNDGTMTAALKASFTIVDPNGYFIPYIPDCSDTFGVSSMSSSLSEPLNGQTQEDAIRAVVGGLKPEDVIESAGYVQASLAHPIARITREGQVIATFFMGKFRDEFIVESGSVCRDSGLSARSHPPLTSPST